MRKVLLLFITVLTGAMGYGQEARTLTLKECVDIALEKNLRIKRSIYNVETFRANMMQAKGAFLPSFNGSASYANNYGRALNPTSNLFVDKNSTTISPSLNSSLTIFNGLRIQNTFRQNQRDILAADYDLQKAKNDAILNVVTLYTNVIFNQELFENAKYQLNSSQQQLDRIKKQVEAGALSVSNQLNQEALVATNELNAINQENVLNLSVLQLKQAMQMPASESIQVEIPDLQMEDLILDKNAEAIYQIATQSMPEMRSALLKVESANLALKASRGNYLPRLTLNGSVSSNSSSLNSHNSFVPDGTYTTGSTPIGVALPSNDNVYALTPGGQLVQSEYTHKDQLGDNIFKNLSFQLTIPILNGFSTRANVQRNIINQELANVAVKETENTLRQSIETAYNDAAASARSYSSSVKQVNAQQEAYRMNKQRFEVGALNIIEYQVSENDLFRAKSDLTRAKYNFIFKKKVLDFYQGKPIDY